MTAEQKIIAKFRKHCVGVNGALAEMRKIHPKACLYLAGSLHMMSGPHHDDASNSDRTSGAEARQDRILFSATFNADGGDW